MKPAPFDLHRPELVADAAGLLAEYGDDAKVLAGGQSLVPMLALRLATPAHLVDISDIAELKAVEHSATTLHIGAGVTHAAAGRDPDVASGAPLLARAVPFVGHAAIRNRGTVGGSIAHADAASEYPAVCVASGAVLVARSSAGERRIPAAVFFTGTYETALRSDEILAAVEFPAPNGRHGAAIDEVARRAGDFALAGAACSIDVGDDGRVERGRARVVRCV